MRLQWVGDITQSALGFLLPHPKYFKQQTGVGYDTNEIFSRRVICVGKEGSGKSTFSHVIALQAYKQYTSLGYTVNACESRDLWGLLHNGISKTDVNILILQDATKADFDKMVLRDLYRIRHFTYRETQKPHGLVLLIVETHRFHDIDKSLRATFDFVSFLSLPNNPYDMQVARRYLGEHGCTKLAMYEAKKIIAKWRKYTVGYLYGNTGEFIVQPPEQNITRQL